MSTTEPSSPGDLTAPLAHIRPSRAANALVSSSLMKMLAVAFAATASLTGCGSLDRPVASPTPTQAGGVDVSSFRDLYRELVETNTTESQGNCTDAAGKMAARLKAAGYPDSDLVQFVPDGHPKDGGLVATLPGSDPTAKPILLLAHIDVVEAKREDWKRDPFKLAEENGYFYARGAHDDKAMAAIFVDSLVRYRQENFTPVHPIRIALTCGEEGDGSVQVNGARWLNENRPDLVDVAFVINEGGSAELDDNNKPVFLGVEAGQKTYQDFTLEVTDEGGHSSQPGPFNAIVALSRGLDRLASNPFPVSLNDTTKAYFAEQAALHPGEVGEAMRTIAANPGDGVAAVALSALPQYNAMLRTTCVATTIEGGHAINALPQRARANVNCRILPDSSPEQAQEAIVKVVADPKISVRPSVPFPTAKMPPLTPAILDPIKSVAASMWPGVPVMPVMDVGQTDAVFFGDTPVYGVEGIFAKPGETHAHGLDERVQVKSLYDARTFLYELAKRFANDS